MTMWRLLLMVMAVLSSVLARNWGGVNRIPSQLDFAVPIELQVGDAISLELKLTELAVSVSINLVAEMDKDGMPYNSNYHHRFDLFHDRVDINSKVNGSWINDPLEVHPSPVKKGDKFKIKMSFADDGINSVVNNQSIFFATKIPVSNIKYITIVDDHWQHLGNVDSVQSLHFDFSKLTN